jgi:hypothetical protein
MTEAAAKKPKAPKPYPTGYPKVGDPIYVPTKTAPVHIIGGRATVATADEKGRKSSRHLTVVELPDVRFAWWDLVFAQHNLWRDFGETPARFPTELEKDALAAKQAAAKAHAEEERAAAAEAERQRWLPLRLQVINDGLLEVPIWGEHHRCRNWGAIISLAPSSPGGIERWWFNRGSGPVKLIVPKELEVHDPVEFGADYIRGSGYREPERWYGVVLEKEETHLLLEPCRDVLHAITLAAERQRAPKGDTP